MAYNIGLNVVEVDGSASPAIVGAAVSVGAFNIQTQRGVPNRPARITSFPQFVQQFGGFFAGGLGAYLVKGFFDNGGQTAYINRVIATDAATGASPAGLTLKDSANVDTLTLQAGYRGTADPGGWGNDLYIKIDPTNAPKVRVLETDRATVQGTPLVEPLDMSAFTPLTVIIDGDATPTVLAFQASDFAPDPTKATLAQIRDAINRQTPNLIASISNDKRLVLTSTGAVAKQRKDWTSLEVNPANATLGYGAVTSAKGKPADRTQGGTRLADVQGLQVGDAVHVADGAKEAYVKIVSIVPATAAVTWTPQIADIAAYDARVAVQRNPVLFDQHDLVIIRDRDDRDALAGIRPVYALPTVSRAPKLDVFSGQDQSAVVHHAPSSRLWPSIDHLLVRILHGAERGTLTGPLDYATMQPGRGPTLRMIARLS